jgi:hypothetical protein
MQVKTTQLLVLVVVVAVSTANPPPPMDAAPPRTIRYPHRLPSKEEVHNNIPIVFSSEPIDERSVALDKGVIQHIEDHQYLKPGFTARWLRLKLKQTLLWYEAVQMMKYQYRMSQAIKRFQRDRKMVQTGVMDANVMRVVYGDFCGSVDADLVDVDTIDAYMDDIFGTTDEATIKKK